MRSDSIRMCQYSNERDLTLGLIHTRNMCFLGLIRSEGLMRKGLNFNPLPRPSKDGSLGWIITINTSYSGGPGFKSWSGERLTRIFVDFPQFLQANVGIVPEKNP
jgi:hypothetical protein